MNRIWTQSMLALALVVTTSAVYADDVTAPTAPVVKKHKKKKLTSEQVAAKKEENAEIQKDKVLPPPVTEFKGDSPKSTATNEDIDQLITNNYARAQSGSKSRYSFRGKVNYYGGTINQPFAEIRPNIGGAAGTTNFSLIGGELSGKYLIDTKKSLAAGVGFRYLTPFKGLKAPVKDGQGKPYGGDKLDADNPYVYYQYLTNWSGVQAIFGVQPTVITRSDLVNKLHSLVDGLFTGTFIKELGKSGVSIALAAEIDARTFRQTSGSDNDFHLSFSPFIEYQFTEKLNLRTVFNLWDYDHYRQNDYFTWDHNDIVQSFGLGISITRDIFLYPNVQFILDHIRTDRTNVAISTAINLW